MMVIVMMVCTHVSSEATCGLMSSSPKTLSSSSKTFS